MCMASMKLFPCAENGSGAVRKKIDDVFGLAMDKADKAALATLIYYPREKMELIKQDERIWTRGIRRLFIS